MFIGIDIGGSSIKGVLTDTTGRVHAFTSLPTGKTAHGIDTDIGGMCRLLAERAGVDFTGVRGIGIGTAGSIDRDRGLIFTSPNIPCLKNHQLTKSISAVTGKPVFIENDATVAVMGELWAGHGREYRDWIMLTLGTGIGGGLVINGAVYTGTKGSSMEVGHTTIDYKGLKCPCGNTGCLELYASATALVRYAGAQLKRYPLSSLKARTRTGALSSKMIYEEALKKDELALHALHRTGEYLGIGLANFVNLFNPQAVILGGGLSRAHKFILPIVKKTVRARVLKGFANDLKYLPIKDEERAPALGAAKVAIDVLHG
jgi:glucokinase